MKKIERQIDEIITAALPAISSGEETLKSILAKYPHLRTELQPRLEAAIWLQQVKFTLATRPGYIHDSRRYLEAKIAAQPHSTVRQFFGRYSPPRWAFNFTAPVVIALLLVLIINNATLTARLAIPGEMLYPTKLFLEEVKLSLTFDHLERADLHIQYSRQRALEFVELVMEGDFERLPDAAERMDAEIIASLHSLNNLPTDNQPAEQVMISNFRDTLSNHILMLYVLKSTSPASAHQGIELAISVAESGLMALR